MSNEWPELSLLSDWTARPVWPGPGREGLGQESGVGQRTGVRRLGRLCNLAKYSPVHSSTLWADSADVSVSPFAVVYVIALRKNIYKINLKYFWYILLAFFNEGKRF